MNRRFVSILIAGMPLLAVPAAHAQSRPPAPSCEVACRVNPFTAPPECDCAARIESGSAAPASSSAAPPASPSAMVEDGVITVREILDYMDALYRQRIAGVRNYYFLERIEFAQAPSAVRRTDEYVLRNASLSVQPAPLAEQAPVPFTTLRTWEKVTVEGHPAMREVSLNERRRRQLRGSPSSAGSGPGQELLEDPSLFLGVLAKGAAAFLGPGAASPVRAMEEEVRKGSGRQSAVEDPFAEDVLAELKRLRQAHEAEAPGAEDLYLGYYAKPGRTFRLGPRCKNGDGCTTAEIENFKPTVFAGNIDPSHYIFCLVWRPGSDTLAGFDVPWQPDARPKAAELWLPIPDDQSPAEGSGSREPHHDRPLRMKVVFLTPTNAGFESTVLERVYDDHRLASGLYEPLTLRQAMGRAMCPNPDVDDPGKVAKIILDRDLLKQAAINLEYREETPEELCGVVLGSGVHRPGQTIAYVLTKRKGFVVNEDWPSPEREAVMLAEPW